MRRQLDLLWEVQRIDRALKSILEDRERLPKELKRLDEKRSIEKERIQKERERIELLEKERKRRELHLNAEMDRIKRAEAKIFEIKTNKEYQALLSEIETLKDCYSREEEEIIRLLEEIDEAKKNLAKWEKEVAATLERIEKERSDLEEKMAQHDAGWKKEIERREKIWQEIDANLGRLYNTLKEKRQGIGIVNVLNETCQGCFLNIPPQMYIEVQKNNSLIQCPNCNRILYWDGNGKGK